MKKRRKRKGPTRARWIVEPFATVDWDWDDPRNAAAAAIYAAIGNPFSTAIAICDYLDHVQD